MHIIRLEASAVITRPPHSPASSCGNVSSDRLVLMHTQIPRKFIFMLCKRVQQIILFTSNATSKPSSAGCATLCFTFHLLMVTSLFSVTFAMRDTVVADICFNHVFRQDPE